MRWITSKDSKLLLGRDVLGKIPPPSLDELKDYGRRTAIRLCHDWMEAEKNRKVTQSLEDAANGAQHTVLKISQNALFAKGLLAFAKKDIVNAFRKEYSDFQLVNFIIMIENYHSPVTPTSTEMPIRRMVLHWYYINPLIIDHFLALHINNHGSVNFLKELFPVLGSRFLGVKRSYREMLYQP